MLLNVLLNRIEKDYPVNEWLSLNAVSLWDYVVLKLYVKSVPKEAAGSAMNVKKHQLLVRACKQIINSNAGQRDVIFFSSASYRTKEGVFYYDKFCDPIADILEESGMSAVIYESGVEGKYLTPRYKDERVTLYYERQQLYSRISASSTHNKNEFTDFIEVIDIINTFFKEQNIDSQFNPDQLIVEFNRMLKSVDYFIELYKKVKPKIIYVICYYSERGMPVTIAANILGIPIYDIQHGAQGESHLAYNGSISENSKLIPTGFWKWNYESLTTADLEINHPWYDYWQNVLHPGNQPKSSRRRTILYSLQPMASELLFRKDLCELIRSTGPDVKWVFRLHPRMNDQFDQLKQIAEVKEINKFIEWETGDNSLFESLSSSAIHITNWSSVCLEAAFFGVPTIFLSDKATKIFENSELFIYNDNLAVSWGKAMDMSHVANDSAFVTNKVIIRDFLKRNDLTAKSF